MSARDWPAQKAEENLAALTTVWGLWCTANDLPCTDAEELLHTHGAGMTWEQKQWVLNFIDLWDIETDRETA